MQIRPEHPNDIAAIRDLTMTAFAAAPFSSGTEAAIVDALRGAAALTLSLVAVEGMELVGHAAFSPVLIDGEDRGWYGLGPVSVRPDRQGLGIGQALVKAGLAKLEERGAAGCVVLGEPEYYGRFGFASDPALRYADVPPQYFQRLVLRGPAPRGQVSYHEAFGAGS
jgi:putative acetyltransferase